MTEITEIYRSKSDPSRKPYEAICHVDGKLMCNCRGWATWKDPQGVSVRPARTCTHIDQLINKHGLMTVARGEFWYAVNASMPSSPAPVAPRRIVIPAKPKTKIVTKEELEAREADAMHRVAKATVTRLKFNVIPETDEDVATYVNPMLASPMSDITDQKIATVLAAISRYAAADWMMEEKYDGHRVVVAVNDGAVTAWSRPKAGKDALMRILPDHLVQEFVMMPTGTYDGEMMIPGGRSYNVTDGKFAGTEIFVIFDILSLLGQSTLQRTYDYRRTLLGEIFKARKSPSVLKLAESFVPSAEAVKAIWARDGEGAILKRRAAYYQPGARSKDFIKVKGLLTCVMTVTGYKAAKMGPHSAVLLKGEDGSKTTVKTLDNDALRAFAADPDSFIGRKLRIEYQERTPDGSYRHPRWDRWESE
jgi:hypothetical protein